MILPCRESPMTGTVACLINGPCWAVVLPLPREGDAEEGQRHNVPGEDLAGASFCL